MSLTQEQKVALLQKRVIHVQRLADSIKRRTQSTCQHLGAATGETTTCGSCKGNVQIKLFKCEIYNECTIAKPLPGKGCCAGTNIPGQGRIPCPSFVERLVDPINPTKIEVETVTPEPIAAPVNPTPTRLITWSYGVTTVPERRKDLFPQTLRSLRNAGFPRPRLFVDGDNDQLSWEREFGLESICRYPKIRTHGNWILTLYELYIRQPDANLYAVFQDDLITYRNLRQYLEALPYPDQGYCNLYTFPSNQRLAPKIDKTKRERIGWFQSNQFGRGAVALLFSHAAVITLLTSPHMVDRPQNPTRGWQAVDGGIVDSFKKAGWKEYCHNPSLVQHVGDRSTMGHNPHPKAASFRGEDFDAMQLLQ